MQCGFDADAKEALCAQPALPHFLGIDTSFGGLSPYLHYASYDSSDLATDAAKAEIVSKAADEAKASSTVEAIKAAAVAKAAVAVKAAKAADAAKAAKAADVAKAAVAVKAAKAANAANAADAAKAIAAKAKKILPGVPTPKKILAGVPTPKKILAGVPTPIHQKVEDVKAAASTAAIQAHVCGLQLTQPETNACLQTQLDSILSTLNALQTQLGDTGHAAGHAKIETVKTKVVEDLNKGMKDGKLPHEVVADVATKLAVAGAAQDIAAKLTEGLPAGDVNQISTIDWTSDKRLKENVQRTGTSASGVPM
jgi:hypothetical protein